MSLMMTTTNPITPPPELLDQWCITGKSGNLHNALTLAYRAGADQELEACCTAIDEVPGGWADSRHLRHVRRPKPPSRKEQALEAIGRLCASVIHDDLKNDAAIVRRALEALPE
jgi:hypothetical protein